MAGPWEKYQSEPQAEGPWTKFQPAPEEPKVTGPTLGGFGTGVVSGLTGNFADELFAAGMTPIEMGIAAYKGTDDGKSLGQRISEGYNRALEGNRAMFKQAREDSPVAAAVGDVTGGLITGGALAKGGLTLLNAAKPTVGSLAARGAAEGALYGGVYGAGEGEGVNDRIAKAATGAGIGGALGGAVGAVAGKVAGRAAENAVPTNEQLKSAAGRAYKAAEDSGVVFTPDGLKRLSQDIQGSLAEVGYHPQLQPRIAVVLNELERTGQGNTTLKGVEQLRKIANAARMSNDPSEQMIGRQVIEHIDDFVSGARPGEILMGDAAKGAESLTTARQHWSALRKSEMLDDALGRAELRAASTGSGGNVDNATRQNVRAILDNPKKRAAFNETEIEALTDIVKGTPTQNALRLIGRFAPQAGGLMTGGNLVAAGASSGASLPFTAAAMGAKATADKMTSRSGDVASAVIRNLGNIPAAANLSPNQRKFLEAAIKAGAIEFPELVNLPQANGQ